MAINNSATAQQRKEDELDKKWARNVVPTKPSAQSSTSSKPSTPSSSKTSSSPPKNPFSSILNQKRSTSVVDRFSPEYLIKTAVQNSLSNAQKSAQATAGNQGFASYNADGSKQSSGYASTWKTARDMYDTNKTAPDIVSYITNSVKLGRITTTEANTMRDKLGLSDINFEKVSYSPNEPANAASKAAEQELKNTGIVSYGGKTYRIAMADKQNSNSNQGTPTGNLNINPNQEASKDKADDTSFWDKFRSDPTPVGYSPLDPVIPSKDSTVDKSFYDKDIDITHGKTKSTKWQSAYIEDVKPYENDTKIAEDNLNKIINEADQSRYSIDEKGHVVIAENVSPEWQARIKDASYKWEHAKYIEETVKEVNSKANDEKYYNKIADKVINYESVKSNSDFKDIAEKNRYRVLFLPDYTYMTQEEQNIYAYQYASDPFAAKDYHDSLSTAINYRKAEREKENTKEYITKNPWAGYIYSFAGNANKALVLADTLGNSAANLFRDEKKPIDPNKYHVVIRGEAAEDTLLETAKTPFSKFMRKQGIKITNSVPYLLIGPEAAGYALATETGGDAAYKTLSNGGTPEQAATKGVVAGLVDLALDKATSGNLNQVMHGSTQDVKDGLTQIAQNSGKEFLTKTEQKLISMYADNLTDDIVMGKKSEMNIYANKLMAKGVSKDDAYRQAIIEFYVKQPLTAVGDSAFQYNFDKALKSSIGY